MHQSVCVFTNPQGGYERMAVVEEGRSVFAAHCGDPVLDGRLISVVVRALRGQGHVVTFAPDFGEQIARFGCRLDGEQVVREEAWAAGMTA